MPSVRWAAPGFRRTTNPNPPSKPASPRPRDPATPAPIASSPAAASASHHPAAKSRPESNAGSNVTEQITPSQPEDSASAVPVNTQINTRAESICRTRSHGAQAGRSATSRSEAETANRQAAPRGARSEATSLTLRSERWTPDGTLDVTEPTDRSEIDSREAARRADPP